ncbi:MAG: amino acid adenylation domain-containing protein, partial [Longimicrobiaceae bacterium]
DGAAHAYWTARFADGVPVLELPADRPRPPVRSYRGERVTRVVGDALVRRLAGAGREQGLTLFHTLLAAMFAWLGRLSGQDDVVVGTPSAGQAAGPEAAKLVGYGIGILPIRARLDASAPFVEHARRVRRSVLEALDHSGFSFPKLVEAVLPRRDPSRPPLFAAGMYLDRQSGDSALGGLRAAAEGNFVGGSRADLALGMTETAGMELRLDCDFSTDLFDAETVERWLGMFERLLEDVARDPRTPLSDLELLADEERHRLLVEWNGAEAHLPAGCVHQWVEARAAAAPGAPAVQAEDGVLDYRELNARANRLAHHLAALGVGRETRVALCLERGAALVTAMLAVLKAGGAYLPLEPSYPAERRAWVLADSGASVLVTAGGAWEGALPPAVAAVRLDADAEAIAARPDASPEVRPSGRDLAYVVYTSGSTGTPKGVGVEHGGLATLCAAYARDLRVTADARASQLISSGFDASVLEIWPFLAEGASLHVVPDALRLDPAALRRFVVEREITHAHMPPPIAGPQLETEWPRDGALRVMVTGGERLGGVPAPDLPFELIVGYGVTECTVASTSGRVDGARLSSIGRPAENSRVYLLDGALRPLPAGVRGEICLGGRQVARGYLGRPALTAERFVPDPFSPAPGARLYRTGDAARWRADGTLEFAGRLDGQVKIRGSRVEPGEIEAVLRRHPEVADCAVVAREDARGEGWLAAYVVGRATAVELRQHLRLALPESMVPAAFVALDALPLNAHGKVDRAALPAPDPAFAEDPYVAPRTQVETVLAGIWEEVLGTDPVGVEQNFFALGGHSLLAMRVVSRVCAVFGVELPLRALFEGPTVAQLGCAVEALRREELPPLPPVLRVERAEAPPLSFAQERLWFLDRLQPGGALYNVPLRLRLEGALDRGALERALGEIVRRHEVLRTTFAEADGAAVQVAAPFAGFSLPVQELSHLPPAEREAEVRRLVSDDAARPFDLAAGPLFRARLLRVDEEDHVLLGGMHHAVTDGWSMGVFFRELSALYGAFREGRGSPLPELAVQYADHAVWERERLRGDRLERQLSWWTERLSGAPALLELPLDHPRPAVATSRGAHERFHLPAGEQERLRVLARSEGVTLYMLLLGAFQLLLGRYAGSDDVVVGSTVAGRTRREVEPLIGLFMNTLVLRTDLSGDPSFREVLRRVREVTLGAFEHQELPFERLVSELRPERSLSHAPVFQVLFELHDGGAPDAGGLAGLRVGGVAAEGCTAKYDLAVALVT